MRTLYTLLCISYLILTIACTEQQKTVHPTQKTMEEKAINVNIPKDTLAATTPSVNVDTDYLMGKFNPNTHSDFVTISSQYASKSNMRLRKETYEAFKQMYNAAKKEGVYLKIISATRNFYSQKSIWEAKWNGKRKVDGRYLSQAMPVGEKALKILRYSSMPGSSRHHWGTDIDLNNLNNNYFAQGTGKKIYDWLSAHAHEYGFCQPYSPMDETRPNGYQEEKWHWSYTPIARSLTTNYKNNIQNQDLKGFAGSESAVTINIVENYVLGINPVCK